MIYVFISLLAIVLAIMIILWFGTQAAFITAFLLLVLILTLRDILHDQWHGKQWWWKMLAFIYGGSATVSYTHLTLPTILRV